MRRKRASVLGVTAGLIAVLGWYLAQNPVLASMLASDTGYLEFDPNIYIDRSLSASERDQILANHAQALARVSDIYGDAIARPKLIFAGTAETVQDLGISPFPARSYLMPWGEYSVFGPGNGTVDIIAHELVHSEIVVRLGYFTYQRAVPAWFNEGAAMQVDFRHDRAWSYIQEDRELPPVSVIASAGEFFSGDRALHYAAAKVEVETWLAADGNEGFYRFLSDLHAAPDFESLYEAYGRN